MAINFPDAPTTNQTFAGPNGILWKWDGAKWINASTSSGHAPNDSPQLTGNPTAPTPVVTDNDTSIATTAFVQSNVAIANNNVGRNLLHNGLFNINQRAQGTYTSGAGWSFCFDRWRIVYMSAGDAYSIVRTAANDSDRAAVGDESCNWIITHNIAGAAGAANGIVFGQAIEGVTRLTGKTVTVSFWAVCGTPLKIGVNVTQEFGSGGSPSAGVILAGQSATLGIPWKRYSFTFNMPSIAGKTLGTNNNDSTNLEIWLSGGANYNSRTGGVPPQTGFINMWGLQLEIGSVATPLEKPDPQVELANCQRFYLNVPFGISGYAFAALQNVTNYFTYPVTMRITATMTVTGNPGLIANAGTPALSNYSPIGFQFNVGAIASGYLYWNGTITASADL